MEWILHNSISKFRWCYFVFNLSSTAFQKLHLQSVIWAREPDVADVSPHQHPHKYVTQYIYIYINLQIMLWPLNWNLRHHKNCWLILHSIKQLGFFEIPKRPKNDWQLLVKVTYDQVWWSILGICALRLTHTRAHTLQWTHTLSSGQPFMLQHPGSIWGFSALLKGTSVVLLKVERALYIHSPHLQFLSAVHSFCFLNLQGTFFVHF